ncbi:SPASM domain-containing protein [Clostridium perfringens]|uniref:SPASM domain-containing protein n=1 Tax=Clostridium perfringens TaxID=1502 RepID=UPI003D2F7825
MKDKNIFLNWFINSNGDIYPDVTLELDDFFIGNIYSNSLNDIYLKLENLSTKLLERNLSNVKCSHCSNALICKGEILVELIKNIKVLIWLILSVLLINNKKGKHYEY